MKEKETIRKLFLASEEEFYNTLTKLTEYKEISNRRNTSEELLNNSINQDIFHLFDEVSSINNEMTAFIVEKAYIKGFSDAHKIQDEAIKYGKEINNMDNNKLDKLLEDKLNGEYETFIDSLKEKSKEEIINKAYEITVKEEIKDELLNMDMYDKEKEILLNTKDVLGEFYKDWLDVDIPLGEVLTGTIEESIATLTRYYKKQSSENGIER